MDGTPRVAPYEALPPEPNSCKDKEVRVSVPVCVRSMCVCRCGGGGRWARSVQAAARQGYPGVLLQRTLVPDLLWAQGEVRMSRPPHTLMTFPC